MSSWTTEASANRYVKTYMKDWLDISGSYLKLRHGNMLVDGGNVGIGTNNPQATLDVSGTTQFNAVDNSQNLFSVFTNNGDSLTKTDTFNISRQVGDYISDTTGGHSYSRIGCFDWIYRIKIGTLGNGKKDTSSFNININYTFAMSRNNRTNSDYAYKIVGEVNINGIVYVDTEGTNYNYYINDYYENRKLSVGKYNDGSNWYVIRHNGYLYLGFWHRQRYIGSGSTSDGSTSLPMRLTGTINTVFSGNNVSIEKPIVFDNVNKDLDVVAAPAIGNIFPTSTGPLWDSNLTSSSTLDELTVVPTEIHFPIGNVGIGSTQPSSKLDVNGTLNVTGASTFGNRLDVAGDVSFNSGLNVTGATTFGSTLNVGSFTIDSNKITTPSNSNILLQPGGATDGDEKVHIKGDLTVDGSINFTGTFIRTDTNVDVTTQLDISNSGTGPALIVTQHGNNDIMKVVDDSTVVMMIKDGGNVGIGSAVPVSELDVSGDVRVSSELIMQNGIDIVKGSTNDNINIGYEVGHINQTQSNSIAIGSNAGYDNQGLTYYWSTGSSTGSSIAIGSNAGNLNQYTSAIAIGRNAGNSDQSYNTVAIGVYAGEKNQQRLAVAIGSGSGRHNQGDSAVAVGVNAGNTSQGGSAVAVGVNAGQTSQGGSAVAVGPNAGKTSQGGSAVAVGHNAGNTSQNQYSVAVGVNAGQTSQGGSAVAVGYNAGYTSQSSHAVALGSHAGFDNQGQFSIGIGNGGGRNNQRSYAVAVGYQAGNTNQEQYAVAIGNQAGYNDQSNNSIAIGNSAGNDNQGFNSIAIGNQAGQTDQRPLSVAIGLQAGQTNQAARNIAIGEYAGQTNQKAFAVAIGGRSGQTNQGTYSIAIGAYAGQTDQPANSIILNASGSALDSSIANTFIVKPVREVDDHTTALGIMQYNSTTGEITYNSSITTTGDDVHIAGKLDVTGDITSGGDITSTSDASVKTNVSTIDNSLDKISQLRGVYFNRNDLEDKDKIHIGLIAQEVETVFPEVINNEGSLKSVAYGNLVAPLIEAIKDLRHTVSGLEARIKELEEQP